MRVIVLGVLLAACHVEPQTACPAYVERNIDCVFEHRASNAKLRVGLEGDCRAAFIDARVEGESDYEAGWTRAANHFVRLQATCAAVSLTCDAYALCTMAAGVEDSTQSAERRRSRLEANRR